MTQMKLPPEKPGRFTPVIPRQFRMLPVGYPPHGCQERSTTDRIAPSRQLSINGGWKGPGLLVEQIR